MSVSKPKSVRTTIYLLRHGETPRVGYCNGHLDVELTPAGVLEMKTVAGRLLNERITGLYTSDLRRARYSAEILADALGVPPRISPGLREKCFGEWQGLPEAELQRRYAEEWADWLRNPADAKATGGESSREMAARVLPEIDAIVKRHLGENIVVVAHGGVNRVILCHALNLDLRYMERIAQRHGAMNIIEFAEPHPSVRLING